MCRALLEHGVLRWKELELKLSEWIDLQLIVPASYVTRNSIDGVFASQPDLQSCREAHPHASRSMNTKDEGE